MQDVAIMHYILLLHLSVSIASKMNINFKRPNIIINITHSDNFIQYNIISVIQSHTEPDKVNQWHFYCNWFPGQRTGNPHSLYYYIVFLET